MRKIVLPKLQVKSWQPLILYAVLLAGIGTLLWFSLGTLLGGYSAHEAQALTAGQSWRYIFDHPLNAPFTIAIRLLQYGSENSLLVTRAAATIFGLATLSAFYWLVRRWHGERAAVLGTVLFGASAWFLHTSRLGTPDVLFFSVLLLVAGMVWHKHSNSSIALLLCFGLGALLLYVPGMVWVILAGVVWQWRAIDRMFRKHLWVVSVGALLLVAALVPLGLAIYHDPEIAKQFAGLPAHGWPVPLDVLRNLAQVPLSLFIHTPLDPERWLGQIAVLDFFVTAMAVLGGFVYAKHLRLDRARLLIIILLLGVVLVGLGGSVSLTLIVPFVYILAAVGAVFMLERWETVFPRNKIAQFTGTLLISLAVLASVGYSTRHYFVAWPQAAETKQIFTVQPPAPSVTIKE